MVISRLRRFPDFRTASSRAEPPIRAELFSVERLEQHAESLAKAQTIAPPRPIESQHGGTATYVQSVPIKETLGSLMVWEGTVAVFDLADHSKANRAYAWSYAMEDGRRMFLPSCIFRLSQARVTRLERQ